MGGVDPGPLRRLDLQPQLVLDRPGVGVLAHLLGDVEGQAFPREQVSESFLTKTDDAMLIASLKKAAAIPAKSLLFNIDQKATLISKDQADALLKVFVKVFDESRGYYGNQGHVARFERDLDSRGQYEAFKDAVKSHGVTVQSGRFAADMQVELVNDGPVTLILDTA